MLTSWSEQSTPAELSIASVLMRPPAGRVLDAAALREAEVAALADDAGAQLAAVHADRVVVAVADLGVRLAGGLHERADAAVPEQVDRRAQDRPHELVRVERLGVDAERRAHLGRQRHRLLRARPHAAAGRDRGRGRSPPTTCPRRARTAARRSAKEAAGSGVGSRKTWRWSNAATAGSGARAACRCRTRRPTCRRCRRP